jgi:hypothetical protein
MFKVWMRLAAAMVLLCAAGLAGVGRAVWR